MASYANDLEHLQQEAAELQPEVFEFRLREVENSIEVRHRVPIRADACFSSQGGAYI
jgi:hypothetical protein